MVIGIDASRGNDAHRTGTEWYSFHLINALKSIIPSTETVILYSNEPLREDWAALPPNWSSKVLSWKPGLLWTQLRLSWEMLRHKPDVLFVPAHTIPCIHPKTVLVAHDIGFEKEQTLYGSTQIGKKFWLGKILSVLVRVITLGAYGTSELDYHRWAMRFGVKHACRIITISDFSKQELLSTYGLDSVKVKVIWHALPKETGNSKTAQISSHSSHSRPFLLFIGRIEVKKNLGVVIKAMSRIQNQERPQLICVGKDGLGAQDIKQQVSSLGLTQDVVFMGYLPEPEVENLRQSALAMILPSRYEGFGLPILEAWRSEVPMLVSRIPALVEVGGEAVEYFNVDSADSCAQAIQRLVSDPQRRKYLKESGVKRLDLFSVEHMAQRTYEVIQECATIRS